MTSWERFDAAIFPGRAWQLETDDVPIQVAEVPGEDIFIVFRPPDLTRRERAVKAIKSRLPFVNADHSATVSGLPFDDVDDAKQFGEALADHIANNPE